MTTILAIDPGSEKSGWVALRDGRPLVLGGTPDDRPMVAAGVVANTEIIEALRIGGLPGTGLLCEVDQVVVEWMTSYGRTVGASTFETLCWIGRFVEACEFRGQPVERLAAAEVMRRLCGGARRHGDPTADAMRWQVLVDRFGGVAGKAGAVGTKSQPGPLYGITSHARAALAVAVAWSEGAR